MARGARFIGGAIGRFLYRYANASLRLIMPSAYGDRKKLTPEIHRHYLDVFRDRDARVLVLHALAKSLLGSRAHYQSLLDRIERLQTMPVLIVWGMKDSAFQPYQLERWRAAAAGRAGRSHRRRRPLAARRGAGPRRRRNRALPAIRLRGLCPTFCKAFPPERKSASPFQAASIPAPRCTGCARRARFRTPTPRISASPTRPTTTRSRARRWPTAPRRRG